MPNIVADPDATSAVTHVAVGIVQDAQGRVLIAQRPPGSHQGGKWEFPGGKVHPQESVVQALARELAEEVGIRVQSAHPFLRTRHAYADREVLLDVWRVTSYAGSPHGREGQPVMWAPLEQLGGYDLPQADVPILRALLLPNLYLISDARRLGAALFVERLERVLRAGARLVQLREKHLASDAYLDLARHVVGLAHAYGAKVLLNAEPGWVGKCGADGVHLSSQQLLAARERPLPRALLVAASCHNAGELAHAERIGADFAVLSPVLVTASHPGAAALGWERFGEWVMTAHLPVYALGGMQPLHLARALEAGAQGIAMVGGVWNSETPEAVIAELS